MLHPAIRQRLRCPTCGSPFPADGTDALVCQQGHPLPVRDGYLDASARPADEATARTFASFGYEWTTFDAIQPEDEAYWRNYVADVPLDELAGRVGLDAGCGKGRFSVFTARHLEALVALDGSDAVQAAARNLAGLDHVVVVRSDLRTPPFAEESFGFISCLGVLHHLPDPRAGFETLVRHLEPGGLMLLYLYSRPVERNLRALGLAAAAGLRRATVRLPHKALRALSAPIAGVLYAGLVLPGQLGDRYRVAALRGLPLQTYRAKPLRSLWLDTFDRLSAPIENRYTLDELRAWFTGAGMALEAARDDAGWFVVLRKPVTNAASEGLAGEPQ
ncbi:MAG TPA: class I SAM-dependent methyltransferase [Actinomycetota bacterium]|nr:class I SAM-dependent methyltransferase [Actinomycetota bacterium]